MPSPGASEEGRSDMPRLYTRGSTSAVLHGTVWPNQSVPCGVAERACSRRGDVTRRIARAHAQARARPRVGGSLRGRVASVHASIRVRVRVSACPRVRASMRACARGSGPAASCSCRALRDERMRRPDSARRSARTAAKSVASSTVAHASSPTWLHARRLTPLPAGARRAPRFSRSRHDRRDRREHHPRGNRHRSLRFPMTRARRTTGDRDRSSAG